MHWLFLYTAIAFEVAGTMALKLSDGFARWHLGLVALGVYSVSFVLLSLSLKSVPVSVAYAIWAGAGTVIVAVIGFVWFKEPAGVLRLALIAMIVVGAVGLNLLHQDP